jgi:hypothetical protein
VTERLGVADVEALGSSTRPASIARARVGYFVIALLIAGIVGWGFWETYYSRF